MGSGVLRADINDEILGSEYCHLAFLHLAVGGLHPGEGGIALAFVFGGYRVVGVVHVVVLTQGIALPVDAEEKAAHIGIADEHDAVEIVDLALEHAGDTIEVGDAVEHRIVAVGGLHAHAYEFLGCGRRKIVDASERCFPVVTNNGDEVVETHLVAKRGNQLVKVAVVGVDHQDFALFESRVREKAGNLILQFSHIVKKSLVVGCGY